MNESELQNRFYNWLVSEKGYPQDSLRIEFMVTAIVGKRKLYIDLAIFDPKTNDIICIVEFKALEFKKLSKESVRRQVNSYKAGAGKLNLPTFVVTPSQEATTNEEFEIFDLTNDEWNKITAQEFPTYGSLTLSEKVTSSIELKQKSKSTIDRFKYICYSLAFLVAFLLILDSLKIFILSAQQLTLAGVFIALIIMPSAAKLKILGIEFERLKTSDKEKP